MLTAVLRILQHVLIDGGVGGVWFLMAAKWSSCFSFNSLHFRHSSTCNPVFAWRIFSIPLTLTGHWCREREGSRLTGAAALGLITQHIE